MYTFEGQQIWPCVPWTSGSWSSGSWSWSKSVISPAAQVIHGRKEINFNVSAWHLTGTNPGLRQLVWPPLFICLSSVHSLFCRSLSLSLLLQQVINSPLSFYCLHFSLFTSFTFSKKLSISHLFFLLFLFNPVFFHPSSSLYIIISQFLLQYSLFDPLLYRSLNMFAFSSFLDVNCVGTVSAEIWYGCS